MTGWCFLNAAQAKAIPLHKYLAQEGYQPVEQHGDELRYHSPLRDDPDPSFDVNTRKNQWIDRGTGEGGSIIDFVEAKHDIKDFSAILKHIERTWGAPAHPAQAYKPPPNVTTPSRMTVHSVHPIANPRLEGYLAHRGVDVELARLYVKEMDYSRGEHRFSTLAFENRAGGHELRNWIFKGSTSPKDITIFDIPSARAVSGSAVVFEGFMDFLTLLTLRGEQPPGSPTIKAVILNSTALKDRALDVLRACDGPIHLFLDNNLAGAETTAYFKAGLASKAIVDHARLYADHEDLNAKHMADRRRSQER